MKKRRNGFQISNSLPDEVRESLYCDGGVAGANPSTIGGCWAWVLVSVGGKKLRSASGFVSPDCFGVPKITNNVTELLAAVQALEAVPSYWDGILYTDSMITLYRLTSANPSFNGVPKKLINRVMILRDGRNWKVKHVAGHPTLREIQDGVNSRGQPVSKWNRACDLQCRRIAKRHGGEK